MSFTSFLRAASMIAILGGSGALLSGCEQTGSDTAYKAYAPIPPATLALMSEKGTVKDAPMLIRAYKKEAEFEIWKRNAEGKYVFLKTYPMCRWSGQLGPKKTEGDRQVPEGFYTITPGQMNPNSHYYLSMNVGYPNAYDRANGRSGGSIMVHGICSSAGCFSMTDKQIEEIYAVARESFAGGQRSIQMQSYPFRMTAENMAKLRLDANMPFWRELKKGSDYFDVTKTETPVGVCNRHYVFGATPKGDARFDAESDCPALNQDPAVASQIAAKEKRDDSEMAELVGKGIKPVRVIYADGGQHPQFQHQFAEVSRPDALAFGATEIALDEGVKAKSVAVQVAAAKATAKALLAKGNVISPVGVAAVADASSVKAGTAAPATAVAPGQAAPPPAVKTAQADVPAAFDAAPSAYAKTEPKPDGKDGGPAFLKTWLSFGEATKPEAAPVVAAAAPAAAAPAATAPVPPLPPRRGKLARVVKAPVAPSAPAPAPQQLSTTLPKQITGEADKPSLPKSLMAWVPGFN